MLLCLLELAISWQHIEQLRPLCDCVHSKVDKPHEELPPVHTTDDQTLAAMANDVNASHLETEHVHKVCH